jgi:hypothetical protein
MTLTAAARDSGFRSPHSLTVFGVSVVSDRWVSRFLRAGPDW